MSGLNRFDWELFLAAMAFSHLAGVIGHAKPGKWYRDLKKSRLTPPNWVFGLMWFLLFTARAVALFLIVQRNILTPLWQASAWLWVVEWLLSIVWLVVFFRMRMLGWALAVLVVLLLVSATVCGLFFSMFWPPGLLYVLVVLWELFALYLNIRVVWKNMPKEAAEF